MDAVVSYSTINLIHQKAMGQLPHLDKPQKWLAQIRDKVSTLLQVLVQLKWNTLDTHDG